MAGVAPELDRSFLSAEQLAHFHEFGYLVIRGLFSPAEHARLSAGKLTAAGGRSVPAIQMLFLVYLYGVSLNMEYDKRRPNTGGATAHGQASTPRSMTTSSRGVEARAMQRTARASVRCRRAAARGARTTAAPAR
jgi:hypothetical protein